MILETVKHLYSQTPYKDFIVDVDGLSVPFNPKWKNIAISVSGGADSALLSYLLSNIIDQNKYDTAVHVISHVRCWKTRPWQKHNSVDVYTWLGKRFPKIRYVRHENFLPPDFEWANKGPNIIDEYGDLNSGDIIEIRAFAEYVGFKENLDAYFNAVTHNPPIKLAGEMDRRNIEPTDENLRKMITTHMDRVSCHPFRFIDKSWVYKQYKRLGILDLYNLTRSCEGEFEDITYKNYIPGQHVPTCGQCFWCLERTWAEEQ